MSQPVFAPQKYGLGGEFVSKKSDKHKKYIFLIPFVVVHILIRQNVRWRYVLYGPFCELLVQNYSCTNLLNVTLRTKIDRTLSLFLWLHFVNYPLSPISIILSLLFYRVFPIDEMGGVVIDVGGANTRFGFAGEDMPKAVFSSVSRYLPCTKILLFWLVYFFTRVHRTL